MIKTEAIESLDGSVSISVGDLVSLNSSGALTTPDGRTITITSIAGGSSSGGSGSGGTTTDTTPPIFDETPTVNSITTTSAVLNASTNETGSIYYSIVSSGVTALTATQIKNAGGAFNGNISVSASPFSTSFNISGLTPGVAYDGYVVTQDTAGNLSSVSKVTFTTTAMSEVQDLTINVTGAVIDALQNNVYTITQESNQPGWSNFEPIITQNDISLATSGGTTIALSQIKFNVKSAGYQIIKILLYADGATSPMTFTRVDSATVKSVANPLITGAIVSNGMSFVTNATYELANILNTDKMPVAGTAGWYSLTTNTDATASFTLTFSSPINVASARIYRCGGTSSFNGGTDSYTVTFIDNAGVSKAVDVPKVTDAQFATITAYTSASFTTTGTPIDIETKKHLFSLSYSYDNVTFTPMTSSGNTATHNTTTDLWSVDFAYPKTTIPNVGQKTLYVKVPDADIAYLKNLKINFWYLT